MNQIHSLSDQNICILDNGTSHTILKDKRYFLKILLSNRPVTTITGINHLEEGHGPACILLPNKTMINITSAIYAPRAMRNLLSFQDIHQNGYHIRSTPGPENSSLQIITEAGQHPIIHETLLYYPPGLYAAPIEIHQAMGPKSILTELWHRRLGHPGTSMYHRILNDTRGIPANVSPNSTTETCIVCAQGKL